MTTMSQPELRDWIAHTAREEDWKRFERFGEKERIINHNTEQERRVYVPMYCTPEEAKYRYADAMLAARVIDLSAPKKEEGI
jgi:N-acetyl-gamma-glutamylphosphate reductase